MKVFFDARYIELESHNGISRFSTELAAALAGICDVTFLIYDPAQLELLPPRSKHLIIHPPTSPYEPLTALTLNKHKPDIVFSPMQTMGSLGRKYKLILTQHDLIYYKYPKPPTQFNSFIKMGWWLYHQTYIPGRMILNQADTVATVSETVKKEFAAAKMTRRPVEVITNAPEDLSSLTKKTVDLGQQPRNLIYMGSFMPYKNVELLIRGLDLLPDDYTLHLLSRISAKRRAEFDKIIPPSKKGMVVFHNGVSDQQYAEILADDAIMVSASQSEGYGLPLVEAIKMGVPCVVNDMEIFHEVGGGGALYFTDEKSFAKKIISLDDPNLRQELVKKGQKHIEKFDWDKSAKKLLDVMTELTTV